MRNFRPHVGSNLDFSKKIPSEKLACFCHFFLTGIYYGVMLVRYLCGMGGFEGRGTPLALLLHNNDVDLAAMSSTGIQGYYAGSHIRGEGCIRTEL